jgi:predicted DNA-binding transcriptional regulator AlpA
MSLLTQAYILEKYGPRVNLEQMCEVLGIKPRTAYNNIATGQFPIPTYLENRMRFADYRDLAEYLDACRLRASSGVPA